MRSSAPTFYIVVPSYNQGQFIGQTVASIVDQAGVNVICLVRDGASTDQTQKVLRSFGKRIQVISKPDKGQTDALNQGLQAALKLSKDPSQDFFAYLNSDDYYLPGALARVAAALTDHPEKHWLVGECLIVNGQGRPIQPLVKWYKKIWRLLLSFQLLLILNPIPQPAVFLRLDQVANVGLFDEKLHYAMDYEYWLRFWKKSGSPLRLDATLAAFRIHAASKGTMAFLAQFEQQAQVAQHYTQNQAWLFLQKLHNKLIILAYRSIK